MDVNSQKLKYKRVIVNAKGGAEVIELIDVDRLEPNHNEVRIKVQAAGLAYADIMARNGNYPAIPKYPYSPGYDMVGVVDKLGENVNSFKTGQRVAALLTKFGAFQEYIIVDQKMLVNVPKDLDSAEVVALILNYLTAYQMMHNMAKVKSGDRVLITSAAGGVGTALIQLGKLAGLSIYGTASKAKLELVEEQGAKAIDYQNQDFVKEIGSNNIDVVFDAIGGKTSARAYRLLNNGGRLVSYGYLSVKGSILPAMLKNYLLKLRPDGKKVLFNMGLPPMVDKNNDWYIKTLNKLIVLLSDGKIKPVIGQRFFLSDAKNAFATLESGRSTGKIVLMPDL